MTGFDLQNSGMGSDRSTNEATTTARFKLVFDPQAGAASRHEEKSPFARNVVWIGVWRDLIRYWVLSSKEVEGNKYYSRGQHRGNTGEGQIHLKDDNIIHFTQYESGARDLINRIRAAYARQIAV